MCVSFGIDCIIISIVTGNVVDSETKMVLTERVLTETGWTQEDVRDELADFFDKTPCFFGDVPLWEDTTGKYCTSNYALMRHNITNTVGRRASHSACLQL